MTNRTSFVFFSIEVVFWKQPYLNSRTSNSQIFWRYFMQAMIINFVHCLVITDQIRLRGNTFAFACLCRAPIMLSHVVDYPPLGHFFFSPTSPAPLYSSTTKNISAFQSPLCDCSYCMLCFQTKRYSVFNYTRKIYFVDSWNMKIWKHFAVVNK